MFVELIHTLGKYYLYDVNTNGIHEISKPLYYLIKNNPQKNSQELMAMVSSSIKNEIQFLLNQNCMSCNRPKVITHTANNYIKSLTTQYLSNMLLQVTKLCNFKCRYCAFAGETNLERNHSCQQMSWNTAKKAIDYLYKNSKFSQKLTIGFYGGEPLLNFDIIKKATVYAAQLFVGRNLTFAITTNLSILSEEMIELFNNYNFHICVSLDGPEKLQNKNRRFLNDGKGTYERVIENVKKLKHNLKDYAKKITINSVTDPEESYYDYVDYFNSEDLFKEVNIDYMRVDTSRLKHELVENPNYKIQSDMTKLKYYLSIINNKIDLIRSNKADEEILESYYYFMPKKKLNDKEHHRGPCVPGARKLFVSANGEFLPCEKVSEESGSMIIGNITDGFDYKNIYNLLNIGKLTEEDCKNCTCIRHCSICAKEIDNIINLDPEIKRNICSQKKTLLKEKIEKHIIFSQVGLFDCIQT